jgi:hypothetical protein
VIESRDEITSVIGRNDYVAGCANCGIIAYRTLVVGFASGTPSAL